MRVTLVQPPSNRIDTSELAPPLSLLTVAAALREEDVDVKIVDMNLECLEDPGKAGPGFYDWATERIASTGPDLVGFTSMALESHIGLELSKRLKQLDPALRVVMGGPHFSAIAQEVLSHYPWVDSVVAGEGELAARGLVRALRDGRALSTVPNLAVVEGGRFRLDRRYKPSASFDQYPFPAYDLVDLERYFALNPYRVLDFEHGRGCVLRCAFCYSPAHWGQGEQAGSIDRVVADMQRHYELGARHLFFVGDNLLNSKAYAKSLANAIADSNPGLTWRCYGTLPQLSEDVVEALARAQCKYIFVGVDAVSDRTKRRYQKTYFRGWRSLRRTIERCFDHELTPTCAFMLNPGTTPEARGDSEEALVMATHAHVQRCGVRLNPLTVYPGSGLGPSAAEHPAVYSEEKPRVLFDGHWVTEQNPYARERPWLFPFHSTVGPPEDYERFVRATHVGYTLLDDFSHSLMQAVHAGLPLWQLLLDTADRVDYGSEGERDRRNQEVSAFARLIEGRTTLRAVREALEIELAEYGIRHRPPRDRVKVDIDGALIDVRLKPHAQLRLSRSPLDYGTTDPLPEGGLGPDLDYLVIPNGPAMRYLRPMAGAEALVRRLNRAAHDGRPISAPAAGIASLLAASVIELPTATI